MFDDIDWLQAEKLIRSICRRVTGASGAVLDDLTQDGLTTLCRTHAAGADWKRDAWKAAYHACTRPVRTDEGRWKRITRHPAEWGFVAAREHAEHHPRWEQSESAQPDVYIDLVGVSQATRRASATGSFSPRVPMDE